MAWDFNDKEPIYLQIVKKIESKILSGEYKAGDKIESVRDLASIAGVNPNTMQKALLDMEDLGLIITQRTLGKFITDNEEVISNLRKSRVDEKIDVFVSDVKDLGYAVEEVIPMISERTSKKEKIKTLAELVEEERDERNDIGM